MLVTFCPRIHGWTAIALGGLNDADVWSRRRVLGTLEDAELVSILRRTEASKVSLTNIVALLYRVCR